MRKTIITALAAAFLSLVVGGASAAVPFANYNLNGNFVIEAHGFQTTGGELPAMPFGENAILGVVAFDGVGGVVPGGGFSFSHVDNFPGQINCSLTVTGGSYAVNTVTGAGTVTMTLGADGGFAGGVPACDFISDNASFTFAFVLNNPGVGVSIVATSASLQLIGFNPVQSLEICNAGPQPPLCKIILGMVMTGSLRLQGSASN